MRLNLALLASGNGSNAQAIIEAAQENILNAEIKLVFTNNPNAGIIKRAKKLNIPCIILNHKDFSSREEFDAKTVEILQEYKVDTVAMAGYMRLVSPVLIKAYEGRILNIHPAILPSFVGAHAIDDAKNWGAKIIGCTVHFVDEIMDNGAIIIQAALPANFENSSTYDATVEKLHALEHKIYIQALCWLADERLEVKGRVVQLKNKDKIADKIVYQNSSTDSIIFPPLEL